VYDECSQREKKKKKIFLVANVKEIGGWFYWLDASKFMLHFSQK
jgi:hypothetical protein